MTTVTEKLPFEPEKHENQLFKKLADGSAHSWREGNQHIRTSYQHRDEYFRNINIETGSTVRITRNFRPSGTAITDLGSIMNEQGLDVLLNNATLKITDFTLEEAKKEKEFMNNLIRESEEVLNFEDLYE